MVTSNQKKNKKTDAANSPAAVTTEASTSWEISQVLRVSKPLMGGAEVKALQKVLIDTGFHCGADGITGIFTKDTALAVRQFQGMNGLLVNGVAGKEVVEKLGGIWKGE